MDNASAWGNYVDYTRDITEFSRKLAFAGIAICWIIKPAESGFSVFSLGAIALIVSFFIFDLAQYSIAAIRWYRWIKSEERANLEKHASLEGDYSPPDDMDRPVFIAFWMKVASLVSGYFLIGLEVFRLFG